MQRRHRLRHRADISAVRQQGRRVKHPLGILIVRPNELPLNRFCFIVSKRVGNAVVRNRARRRLREVVRQHIDQFESGWDCILIARTDTPTAAYSELEAAILHLFKRVGMKKRGERPQES